MDINSLLSPQESPRETPSPPAKPSPKKARRPKSTKFASAASITASPLSQTTLPPQTLSHTVVLQAQHARASPPIVSPASRLRMSATDTPPTNSMRPTRQPLTPGMDTLADLASMQHHQQTARVNSGGLRSAEIYDHQPSQATVLPNVHSSARPRGISRSSLDLTMADVPTHTPSSRTYSTNALTEAELGTVTELVRHLSSHPFAYESHVQLIKLLHQGLLSHIGFVASPESRRSARTYDLLQELQKAREAMNARFALGEDLWAEWIEDQKLLADTLEDGITVMESCKKAVEEEAGSSKLWILYGEWMLSMYSIAHPRDQRIVGSTEPPVEIQKWSEEDRSVATVICSWQQMMEVWNQGAQDTRWRINDSQLLWDRYTELLLYDLASSPSESAIAGMKSHFMDRLRIPHATWDQTFQTFSSFISQYDDAAYEDTMIAANQQFATVKVNYDFRAVHEWGLQAVSAAQDKTAEWTTFADYIDWEASQSRKHNPFAFEMVNVLYQRATLRFPTDTGLWEGFVMFLYDEIMRYPQRNLSALPVLERATRHCPWSGTLWSQYLVAAERSNLPFADIGRLKHRATSTGLLDAGDMSEVLNVHTAWCGFLRRRAFHLDATDEDLDVAEVGIRSAIEDMETLGKGKHGKDYKGDPEYRLERIYIKYLTQSRNIDGARSYWQSLIPSHGDSHDFWLRYYLWEMSVWGKMGFADNVSNGVAPHVKPSEATKVLRTAIMRPKLDWPEKMLEVYRYHCEDHEDAEELQSSVVQIWKRKKVVKRRREREALEAYGAQLSQAPPSQQAPEVIFEDPQSNSKAGKRKRDADLDARGAGSSKKSRQGGSGDVEMQVDEQALPAPSSLKRDRENATITVRNLPAETTETRVRQYFRDCGTINGLKLLPENDGASATATIEFDSAEDVLAAQTKDMKTFDGNTIEVQVGTGSTLFVTNFPPTADEIFIREKFEKYGEIVDIRFPSLQYNTHRRFCYVQFKYCSQAQAAIALNGEVNDKLKLIVKISDPANKQDRQGPIHEGRELYVANVDWSVTEDEIRQVFSKYGTVEKVRIPTNIEGKSKGIAFVVFSNKDEATAALALNLTKYKSRLLNVLLATNNKAKRLATTIITSQPRTSSSRSPSVQPQPITNGEQNTASPHPTMSNSPAPTYSRPSTQEIQSRTLTLLNIPDTINDARIRALVEPYGPLVKIILRPDHQGAIIEFGDVISVGKASLALDGKEIAPGRAVRVETVGEMMKQKAEWKRDRIVVGGVKKESGAKATPTLLPTGPIKRPVQPGGRRGGRGGLGIKGGGVGLSGSRAATGSNLAVKEELVGEGAMDVDKMEDREEKAERGGKKSNSDFKAMFLKGKETNEATEGTKLKEVKMEKGGRGVKEEKQEKEVKEEKDG